MADISSVIASEREVDIVHPVTQEPIGLKLTVRPDSAPEVRAVERKWLTMGLRGRRITAEQMESRGIEILVAHVSGWAWGNDTNGEACTFDGGTPEFNEPNLRKVLKALPWIKKQLDVEAGNDSGFFKG